MTAGSSSGHCTTVLYSFLGFMEVATISVLAQPNALLAVFLSISILGKKLVFGIGLCF